MIHSPSSSLQEGSKSPLEILNPFVAQSSDLQSRFLIANPTRSSLETPAELRSKAVVLATNVREAISGIKDAELNTDDAAKISDTVSAITSVQRNRGEILTVFLHRVIATEERRKISGLGEFLSEARWMMEIYKREECKIDLSSVILDFVERLAKTLAKIKSSLADEAGKGEIMSILETLTHRKRGGDMFAQYIFRLSRSFAMDEARRQVDTTRSQQAGGNGEVSAQA